MDFLFAIMLGIIEGLIDFSPISSAGQLLVASALLSFPPPAYRLSFDVFIQIGAVVAVIVYYARDLLAQAQKIPSDRATQRFWLNILIAFLPAAIFGLLVEKRITEFMHQTGSSLPSLVVGAALIVGGILFLLIECEERPGTVHTLEEIIPKQALIVRVAQVVSLIPGVSRSGASIIGGLLGGLGRVTATAFSVYLFIPTLGGATPYKMYSGLK